MRKYRKENRAYRIAGVKNATKWAKDNPEKFARNCKRYKHSEKGRISDAQGSAYRRARKLGAPGFATAEQIKSRVDYYGGKCYMCGADYAHIDHVIPLSRGGSNWPDNLRPSCAPCNMHKYNKVMTANMRQ